MLKVLFTLLAVWLSCSVHGNGLLLPEQNHHVVGEPKVIVALRDDTFSSIAQRYGVGFDALSAANPLVNPWFPGAGTTVTIPTRFVLPQATWKGIVVNLAELRLYYFPPDTNEVYIYPVGIGRAGWETPVANTTVTRIDHNPVWRPPASIKQEYRNAGLELPDVVAAGPDNPLGDTAIRLELAGYLLHGTNKPEGVGMRVSHGCIRLYPQHIRELAAMVSVGTEVSIINQPVKWGRSKAGIVVEAHRERLSHKAVVARAELVSKNPELSDWLDRQRTDQTLFTGIPLLYREHSCNGCVTADR